MRDNSKDLTLERNYIQKWRFLIHEYQLVKARKHPRFRFAQDFYAFHGTTRQTFAKYYNRFLRSPPMTPSSPVSGVPGGRAAAPSLSLSRRSSTNASTVPTVTRSMPYSSLYSNTTLPSLPPSTPSPGATASTDSPHRCSSPSGRSSRPGQGSLAT